MKGADEYYDVFGGRSEQIGKLYLKFHKHARGKCFQMYVMPEGAKPNQYGHAPENSVEVYGVTGGQRGWTETYGWLHEGPWQADFMKIVSERKAALEEKRKLNDKQKAESIKQEAGKTAQLLASY